MNIKIALTTTSFAKFNKAPIDLLEKAKIKAVVNPYARKLSEEETVELCEGCVGVVAGTEIYSHDVLAKLPSLKIISRCGTGTDNIDMKAAEKQNVRVFNTPDAPVVAVAELTIALTLNLLRRINSMDTDMKAGKWEKHMGNLLSGKKAGIVGYGRIGKRVSGLLSCFGCEVSYTDPIAKNGPSYVAFEKLLSWADVVFLHVSGSDMVLGEKEISLMKKGSWLVNVSRGSAIDEKALENALKTGHLAGAAIDVFDKEPYNGSLKKLNNVLLTPHIGSYAKESRIKMEIQAVENLLTGLRGLT